jgi:hypothetical protein
MTSQRLLPEADRWPAFRVVHKFLAPLHTSVYLIMAAIFVVSKWMGAQQQGKEEGCSIGFGKSYFSRFT